MTVYGILSGVLGFLAVAFGAFGAHALKSKVSDSDLVIWHTAVQYQFYHALALGLVILLNERVHAKYLWWAGALFVFGSVVFSGSLYTLVLTQQRWLGAVTPLGGLAFLAGWLCFILSWIKNDT